MIDRRQLLLPGLLLAVTLHAFHAMAVVTVLPQVSDELQGRALYGAFFSAYMIASLVGLVWAGRALAAPGVTRVFSLGLAAFALGLLASASAPSMPWLVAARVLEGFGGGVITTVLYAVVNRAYDETGRPRVLALLSAAWVLPGLLGPPVAGFVAEAWGWRWVFLGVLPAVAAAGAMALPALGQADAREREPDTGVGLPHAFALAGGVALVLYGMAAPFDILPLLAVVAGAALLFPAAARILPPGTLRAAPGLPAAIAAKFLANFAFFGAEAFLPLLLRERAGWSLVQAGTVLTVAALCWTAGAFTHARNAQAAWLPAAGSAGVLLGILGVGLLAAGSLPVEAAYLVWGVAGFGMGVAYNGATAAAMSDTLPGAEGATSTALGIADALGFALAAALGGAVLTLGENAGYASSQAIAAIAGVMLAFGALTPWAAWRMEPASALGRAGEGATP